MLTADLTVTSNAGTITLPGDTGATVFAQITGPSGASIKRKVAATANTTPEILTIGHTESGSGFKRRLRSMIKLENTFNNTDVADTGGVTPSFGFHCVLDRPIQSGGVITDAIVTRQIARVLHVLLASGQLTKFLNQEA